jgi:hypothetical protein
MWGFEKEAQDKTGREGKCAETPENNADVVNIAASPYKVSDDAKHRGTA